MKKFLTSTVAASALALMLGMASARAEDAVDPNAKQGGAIIVTYKDDIATLDPAIGYDWQNWSMIKSLFDGLMDYEPGTTESRPDLAESYEISPDGLTYTFKLRHGVKFHNGREMTADDVKYSIERADQPEDAEPGRRLLRLDQGLRRCRRRQGDSAVRHHRRRPATPSSSSCRGPTPPSCM